MAAPFHVLREILPYWAAAAAVLALAFLGAFRSRRPGLRHLRAQLRRSAPRPAVIGRSELAATLTLAASLAVACAAAGLLGLGALGGVAWPSGFRLGLWTGLGAGGLGVLGGGGWLVRIWRRGPSRPTPPGI